MLDWTAQLKDGYFDESKAEHITISAEPGDHETAKEKPPTTTRFFSQSGKAGTVTRNFTMFDEQTLAVSVEHQRAATKQYSVNLAFLDPAPARVVGIAWGWLCATLVLATAATVTFGLGQYNEAGLLAQQVMPGLLLAVAATIACAAFIHRTNLTLTFYSLHGRAPLLEIDPRHPDRAAVEHFVGALQDRIRAARDGQGRDKSQFLREELRAHHRLFEDGTLPEAIYEASKARILAQHG